MFMKRIGKHCCNNLRSDFSGECYGYWCPVPHLNSILLIIVYPAPTSCFKWLPGHRSAFTVPTGRKTQALTICIQSHSADRFGLII